MKRFKNKQTGQIGVVVSKVGSVTTQLKLEDGTEKILGKYYLEKDWEELPEEDEEELISLEDMNKKVVGAINDYFEKELGGKGKKKEKKKKETKTKQKAKSRVDKKPKQDKPKDKLKKSLVPDEKKERKKIVNLKKALPKKPKTPEDRKLVEDCFTQLSMGGK